MIILHKTIKFITFIIIFLILLCFSGCIDITSEITLNQDGSATQAYKFSNIFGDMTEELTKYFDDSWLCDSDFKNGVYVTSFHKSASSLEQLNLYDQNQQISLTSDPLGLTCWFKEKIILSEQDRQALALSGGILNYRIIFNSPFPITYTTGSLLGANRVEWQLGMQDVSKEQVELVARMERCPAKTSGVYFGCEILTPCLGMPAIVKRGENLELKIKGKDLTKADFENSKIVLRNSFSKTNIERIQIYSNNVSRKGKNWEINFQITDDISPDLYDLSLEAGKEMIDFKGHAVKIVESFNNNIKIVHITDVHISQKDVWICINNGKIKFVYPNPKDKEPENLTTFLNLIKKVNSIKPDFVVITGDLVEWSYIDNWQKFHNALLKFEIPVFVLPGNHDFRQVIIDEDKNLYSYIETWFSQNYMRYYWENITPVADVIKTYGEIDLIFLNSGPDFFETDSYSDFIAMIFQPDGAGLTEHQMQMLKIHQNERPKLCFMHHPSVDGIQKIINNCIEDACAATIEHNQFSFNAYCTMNNVLMVLSGHNHADKVIDMNYNFYNSNINPYEGKGPIFIQTVPQQINPGSHHYRNPPSLRHKIFQHHLRYRLM